MRTFKVGKRISASFGDYGLKRFTNCAWLIKRNGQIFGATTILGIGPMIIHTKFKIKRVV